MGHSVSETSCTFLHLIVPTIKGGEDCMHEVMPGSLLGVGMLPPSTATLRLLPGGTWRTGQGGSGAAVSLGPGQTLATLNVPTQGRGLAPVT